MKIQFTFLGGARAGQSETFSEPFIQIGRHPHCDLRFDADRDLDVSSRHSSVTMQAEMYTLRDLGSTNGTYINGKRLTADHVLVNGDVIQFGKTGPRLEVNILRDERPGPAGTQDKSAVKAEVKPALPTASPEKAGGKQPGVRRTPEGGGTAVRVKAEVARQTAHLRRTTIILLGLLIVLASAYVWQSVSASRRIKAEQDKLMGMVDSLSTALRQVQTSSASLQASLDSAQAETAQLKTRIGRGGSAEELAALRAQLSTAMRRQQSISSAASIDAGPINNANKDAVAVVLVEFADGTRRTGSGFAVQSDGQSSLLITNRHVVTGTDGSLPTRVGAIFNGSKQNFRAEVVTVATDEAADLALIRVPVRGGTPVVHSIAPTREPEAGDPVVMVGYPLGLDMEMGGDWQTKGVSTALTTGTISKALSERLLILGYGAPGMSGSPVFDRTGAVIGVVFGGQRDSEGKLLLAVPVKYVREILQGH
ncbi:MAG TPA: trypsin-like peptidase domain-containing protein [Gemmatimonadales bacterium]|nr:trypsin-like peptidase domain-containing protein [Gemmatimonadales bacterium]